MSLVKASKPFGYSIFCDDIRQEIDGKLTFVGVYSNLMIINVPFPINIPKLGIYINFIEEVGATEPIFVNIYMPGEEDKPSHTFQIEAEDLRERAKTALHPPHGPKNEAFDTVVPHTAVVVFSPQTLTQEGTIRVRATRGDKTHRLGMLQVIQAPS